MWYSGVAKPRTAQQATKHSVSHRQPVSFALAERLYSTCSVRSGSFVWYGDLARNRATP